MGISRAFGGHQLQPTDERDRRIRELEERLSLLGEAGLRINEDLDFNTVLQGVLDSARSLTGARYGVLVLHDADGTAGDFLASGMTPEETGGCGTSGLAQPLPAPEPDSGTAAGRGPAGLHPGAGPARARSSGGVSQRVSFLAFPILHRGDRVGSIFLAEKEDGLEFTRGGRGDPGAVRCPGGHGHRQRPPPPGGAAGTGWPGDAGGHLPVGVAVFDAATGLPRSFNREARRIVDSLRDPDQSPQDLLEVVTFRRPTGGWCRLGSSRWRRRCNQGRRCGPRRWSSAFPTGGASRCCSTPRPSYRRGASSSRWW